MHSYIKYALYSLIGGLIGFGSLYMLIPLGGIIGLAMTGNMDGLQVGIDHSIKLIPVMVIIGVISGFMYKKFK